MSSNRPERGTVPRRKRVSLLVSPQTYWEWVKIGKDGVTGPVGICTLDRQELLVIAALVMDAVAATERKKSGVKQSVKSHRYLCAEMDRDERTA